MNKKIDKKDKNNNFSEIYIGPNGVGKTIKIEERKIELEEDGFKCFYVKVGKNNNIDDDLLKGKTNPIKELNVFLNEIFTFKYKCESWKDDIKETGKLSEKLIEFLEENKKIKTEVFENIEEKIKNDINLKGIFDKNKEFNFIEVENKKEETESLNLYFQKKKFSLNFPTNEKKHGKKYENIGTGNLQMFQLTLISLFLETFVDNDKNKNKMVLIIDEPETFLHHSTERKVAYMLKKISKKIKIIFSSHSYNFVNFFINEETKIYRKTYFEKDEFKEIPNIQDNKSYKIFEYRKEYIKVLFSKGVILCEGNNDIKFMEYIMCNLDSLLSYEEINKISTNITIIVTNGKYKKNTRNEFENNFNFKFNSLKDINNLKFFIIYDDDKDKNKKILLDFNDEIEEIRKKNPEKVLTFSFDKDIEKFLETLSETNEKINKNSWDPFEYFDDIENLKKNKNFNEFFNKFKEFLKIL